MNFLACEGNWQLLDSNIRCEGELHAFTQEELAGSFRLSAEDSSQLYDMTVSALVSVFVILVLKKHFS